MSRLRELFNRDMQQHAKKMQTNHDHLTAQLEGDSMADREEHEEAAAHLSNPDIAEHVDYCVADVSGTKKYTLIMCWGPHLRERCSRHDWQLLAIK